MFKVVFVGSFTALLIILSFPPFKSSYLAWISLVPFFSVVRRETVPRALLSACVMGVTLFSSLLFWIINDSWLVYLTSIGVGTLCWLICILGIRCLECRVPRFLKILLLPSLWTSLEWLVNQYPINLPLSLGLTQVHQHNVLQISSITGVYGISFLLILSNSVIALVVDSATASGPVTNPLKNVKLGINHWLALVVGMVFLETVLIGLVLNPQASLPHPAPRNHLKVAIIQGNIPNSMQRSIENASPEFENINEETFFSLSFSAIKARPDIIVWPETAVGKHMLRLQDSRNRLYRLVRESRSYLILGSPDRDEYGHQYNSAFIISPQGKLLGRHDKVYLAPSEGDFATASKLQPIRTPIGIFGINICYESTLPQVARSLVNQGASLLFILTNDAGFKKSPAPYLHANEAILRAVENRTYVIHAANTGISQVIDPYGKILTMSSLDRREVLYATVSTQHPISIYSRVGDLFSYFCLGMLTICLLVSIFRRSDRHTTGFARMVRPQNQINPKDGFLQHWLLKLIASVSFVALCIFILVVISLVKVGYDNTSEKHRSFSMQQSIRFVSDYFHDPEIE